MRYKRCVCKTLIISIIVTMLICGAFINNAFTDSGTLHMTGLPELTPEELEWQNKHMLRVRKVKPNTMAFERINRWREKKGLPPLPDTHLKIVPVGEEIEGTIGGTESAIYSDKSPGAESHLGELPPSIDNSTLKYFPPISSQGSLPSCGCFSGTYYTMTYMHALARDLDAKNGGDNYRFSPKWTYNMVNGGERTGSWYYWAYAIGIKHGAATWEEFPYDSDYREWCGDTAVWRNAINRRFAQYGYVADTHLESGIDDIKQMLVNGYILNIPTYIYSWQNKAINDDPSTTEDDPFVGTMCCFWVNGTAGYHAMTVIGYNDHIWVDVNSNGNLDSGEKGAFRIANSWGTGWQEGGFSWMAYDALKNPSAVQGGPSNGRIHGWYPTRAHWVTARSTYEPTLVAEFTLSHLTREQLCITLGISEPDNNAPDITWYPEMIYSCGGPYAFDGSTTACDCTFVFDFTDIAPSDTGAKRYYLGLYDSTDGYAATLKGYKLIDAANENKETICYDIPKMVDSGKVYASVDYDFDDGNIRPVALLSADPVIGPAPLSLLFDGTGSYDTDGEVISYEWNFGDGTWATGASITHVYEIQGTYTATLTVTDNRNGTDQASVVIEVQQDPSKCLHVEQIDMSLLSLPGGIGAQANVIVTDADGNNVPGATVTGLWEGLLSGLDVAVTDINGAVTIVSNKTKKSGIIIFRVTDVSASGFVYAPEQNSETQDSLSTDTPVNEKPTAVARASLTTGVAPLTIDFYGYDSRDPDGQIVVYEWDFGDGQTARDQMVTHTYINPGTYESVLIVTDNEGAMDSVSLSITVTSEALLAMYVNEITMSIVQVPGGNTAQAIVTIVDSDGTPVRNATVTGVWSGLVSGETSASTDDSGSVVFISKKSRQEGTFTFNVKNVSAIGHSYESTMNKEIVDSILNP
ncbi:MAG: PKD domain-containing protein [bacterium]